MWPSTNSITKNGPLVDRLVGAQADRLGHRDARRPERVHEPVLAHHVMGRRQDVVDGRPAQDPGPARRLQPGRSDWSDPRRST
jgi:hypothetical protein